MVFTVWIMHQFMDRIREIVDVTSAVITFALLPGRRKELQKINFFTVWIIH